jgi:hypothetical protein
VDFDSTVEVGHILTSVTIALSVLALLISRAKDRRTREHELANAVRGAAARTLAKLERWEELALWYYSDAKPLFIDASDKLAEQFDVEGVRDFLWRSLENARLGAAERIRDEELEEAYVELYAYDPRVYERFRATLVDLKAVDLKIYGSFLEAAQGEVLAFQGRRKGYAPPLLGNALRRASSEHERDLQTEIRAALGPLHDFLVEIVSSDDRALLARRASLL